jgi:hypothetical protein
MSTGMRAGAGGETKNGLGCRAGSLFLVVMNVGIGAGYVGKLMIPKSVLAML